MCSIRSGWFTRSAAKRGRRSSGRLSSYSAHPRRGEMRSGPSRSYPLVPMQEGMLFHTVAAPGAGAYICELTCEFGEDLDRNAFHAAWRDVVQRHEVLRTRFEWGSEHVMQHVDDVTCAIEESDWRHLNQAEQRLAVDEQARLEFDLATAPLMRMRLCRTASGYLFIWTHHHALLDGRARVIVLNDVARLYEAYRLGANIELPSVPRYKDYVTWLHHQDSSSAERYWRQLLGTFSSPAQLTLTESTHPQSGYGTSPIGVAPALSSALRRTAARLGVTVNILVQCAWAILIGRYTGQSDVVFGATRSCRRSSFPDASSVVGVLMNTLPHRALVNAERPVSEVAQQLREQAIALRTHQHTPLMHIRAWTKVASGVPLFNTVVVFEESRLAETMRSCGSNLWRDARRSAYSHYGLTLAGYAKPSLELEIDFSREGYDLESVAAMGTQLCTLLEGIAANADRECGTLDMLSAPDRRRVLEESTGLVTRHADQTLADMVEQSAARNPGSIAVLCEGAGLTYEELNERSNRLAHFLIGCRIGPECRVALAMPRSIDAVVAMLAIFKAGAAYVPLDIEYPADRLRYIVENARVSLLITTHGGSPPLPDSVLVIALDEPSTLERLARCRATNPTSADRTGILRPQNAAYLIYTSGSTGRPKGVVVSHSAIVNKCGSLVEYLRLTASTRFAATSSLSFDPSLDQVFCPLISGGACVIVPDGVRDDPKQFAEYAERHRISVLNATPGLIEQLVREDAVHVDTLIVGADVFSMRLAEAIRARGAAKRVLNFYGPTETCINASGFEVAQTTTGGSVPIGRPLPGYRLYVLSDGLSLMPFGAPGELYIGGVGLARGYYGQPAATATRFLPDPFGPPGTRMYRTGDHVRRRRDGNLEFLGRTDRQVKLRGFRIEPGEIETLLLSHERIIAAAVVIREHIARGLELVAYVIAHGPEPPTPHELRRFLGRTLPAAMVPSAFVFLDRLPLNTHGKVDVDALPDPQSDPLLTERTEVMSAREKQIAAIWGEVLGVVNVGPDDDFFELGGHSLAAMQIVARLRDRLQTDLSVRTFFDTPTPRQLARATEGRTVSAGLFGNE